MALSRRQVEDLRSALDRAIYRTLGHSDSSVLSTVSSCLTNGYERRKMIDKISSHIDSKKASKLADKVLALADEAARTKSSSSKKRTHEGEARDSKRSKTERGEKQEVAEEKSSADQNGSKTLNGVDVAGAEGESVGETMTGLSASRIRLMMANAQKEIEERKRALVELKGTVPGILEKASSFQPAVSAALMMAQQIKQQIREGGNPVINPLLYQRANAIPTQADIDKQRKIAELQARIQRKLEGGTLPAGIIMPAQPDKPTPLILDQDGRTVDNAGRRVTLTHVAPTLKANIRARRREEFRAQLSAGPGAADACPTDAAWHDERVAARPAARARRSLRFFEPGKFRLMAERLRMKAQLEKLQSEISQIARKTGISSATKLALLAADTPDADHVPDIEWWDSVILMTAEERAARRPGEADAGGERGVEACNTGDDDIVDNLNEEAVTDLVEHPQQCRPPTEPLKPVYMPVFLTKAERKKLRRQNRREAWKEEQEKVRLGLEAPAEPKLRISNLMRALGTEAVQDPTAIEAKVREQIARRQKTHQDANEARALTSDQRKEKIDRKIQEDTSGGVHVAVYRVRDLFECASHKFKVERNAGQLHMTGCVLLHRGCCVVVAEGGPRQHAKYKRLMLHRIKWEEDTVKDLEGEAVPNSCTLVWEGTAQSRAFGEMKFKVVPTEKLAREHFQKHKVEHYWDLAYSSSVLDSSAA